MIHVSDHAVERYCSRSMKNGATAAFESLREELARMAGEAESVRIPPHAAVLSLAKHGPAEHRLHTCGIMLVVVIEDDVEHVVTCYPYDRRRLKETSFGHSIDLGNSKNRRRRRLERSAKALAKKRRRSVGRKHAWA